MKRIKIKTIFCHVAIIAICMGVFCHGYMGVSISVYDGINVYAQDPWEDVNQDDLVTAFRYYCKSRNLTIDGSIADALTSFTTTSFNNICNTLGIDVNSLQANLKKTVEGNLGLRFLMNQQGVLAYNRIFAEFLQNNDLSVGDNVDNKILYSGKYFVDYDGISCLVYVTPFSSQYLNFASSSNGVLIGTPYKYTSEQMISLYNTNSSYLFSFNLNASQTYSNSLALSSGNYTLRNKNTGIIYNSRMNKPSYQYGNPVIYYCSADGKYYFGVWHNTFNGESLTYSTTPYLQISSESINTDDANIYVTTNNNTINNNNYNNNYTIIYNDGDTYISDDDDEPLPTTPPGGGGGGGDDTGDWNPTTPTIPGPSSPDFPSIDLPDIDIPDLPSLNFSLGDLREKFPFSLPFDIIAVLNVLDGEPKAPHIEATVPIGKWYTWEIDFDFSEFDNYARLFRAFEFIGFCIGLAVFTVHFVKG